MARLARQSTNSASSRSRTRPNAGLTSLMAFGRCLVGPGRSIPLSARPLNRDDAVRVQTLDERPQNAHPVRRGITPGGTVGLSRAVRLALQERGKSGQVETQGGADAQVSAPLDGLRV